MSTNLPKIVQLDMTQLRGSAVRVSSQQATPFTEAFKAQHDTMQKENAAQREANAGIDIKAVIEWSLGRIKDLQADQASILGYSFVSKKKGAKLPEYQIAFYEKEIIVILERDKQAWQVKIDFETLDYRCKGNQISVHQMDIINRYIEKSLKERHASSNEMLVFNKE